MQRHLGASWRHLEAILGRFGSLHNGRRSVAISHMFRSHHRCRSFFVIFSSRRDGSSRFLGDASCLKNPECVEPLVVAVQLATATTVIIASGFGLPISTTQTLVGGVLGVGLARGMGAINLSVVRNILASWLITVPAGMILSAFYFLCLKAIL